jgi:hypothetical protein
MSEEKVIHEIRLHKSVRAVLWAFAAGFIIHALPTGSIIPKAWAELSSNPTITLVLSERRDYPMTGTTGLDIDD